MQNAKKNVKTTIMRAGGAENKNRKGNGNMGKKKGTAQKKKMKNSNVLLIVTAAIILCVAVGVTLVVGRNKTADTAAEKSGDSSVQTVAEGESLIIPVSDISSTASFYTVEVDGTQMEVLAVLDSEGNIRTAFNTCQICYGSGRGYYVQSGDVLVCQNCGNRFTVDQVEIESGGCNPWPIFAENKTVTEDSIEISYDFLLASKKIFANWKTQYS